MRGNGSGMQHSDRVLQTSVDFSSGSPDFPRSCGICRSLLFALRNNYTAIYFPEFHRLCAILAGIPLISRDSAGFL